MIIKNSLTEFLLSPKSTIGEFIIWRMSHSETYLAGLQTGIAYCKALLNWSETECEFYYTRRPSIGYRSLIKELRRRS